MKIKSNFQEQTQKFSPMFQETQFIEGFSPIVETEETSEGHRVIITDINGTHSFDVENGKDGYTPIKGEDYWTEADKEEIVDEVQGAIDLSGKLDKITEPSNHQRVYSVDETGAQDMLPIDYSNEANEGNIPRRNSNLSIYIPNAPEEATEAVNKEYVDGELGDIDKALDEIIKLQNKLLEEGTTFDQNNYYTKIEADNTFVTQQDFNNTVGNINDLLYKLNNGGIV